MSVMNHIHANGEQTKIFARRLCAKGHAESKRAMCVPDNSKRHAFPSVVKCAHLPRYSGRFPISKRSALELHIRTWSTAQASTRGQIKVFRHMHPTDKRTLFVAPNQ